MKMMVFYDEYDPDYGACMFLEKYNYFDVYTDMLSKGIKEMTLEDDDNCFTIELHDFDIELTEELNKLIDMLTDDFMDYDQLKGKDFRILEG